MAVSRLLPWLALGLGGCLGLNPAFDDGDEGASGSGSGSGPGSMSSGPSSGSNPGSESGSSSASDGTSGGSSGLACIDDPDLVLCFDFESLTDDMFEDGSPYGHDATAMGAEIADGPWGKGLVATPQLRVEVPCFEECETDGPLTLEARVRIDELPPPGRRAGIVDNDQEYAITYTDEGLRCANGEPNTVIGSTLAVGEWAHVACVNDGGMLRLYIDGEEDATAPVVAPGPVGDRDPIAIANTAPAWNEPFVGAIDCVRVWTRARTAEEIAAEAG